VNSGLKNHSSTWTNHGDGGAESIGRPGSIDDIVESGNGQPCFYDFGVDAGAFGDAEFAFVTAIVMNSGAGGVKNLCNQETELSVAEHRYRFAARDVHLIEDLAGRGNRFDEDGVICGERFRDDVEVPFWEREEFAERARVFHDAEDGAIGAVTFERTGAPLAAAAGEVDLTGDALADPARIVGFDDLTDELVTGCSTEAVVAALEFEVGVADAAAEEAKERESLGAAGPGHFAEFDATVFEVDGKHSGSA
jgi:hypothetical protein